MTQAWEGAPAEELPRAGRKKQPRRCKDAAKEKNRLSKTFTVLDRHRRRRHALSWRHHCDSYHDFWILTKQTVRR
jgi:hypothetical protein